MFKTTKTYYVGPTEFLETVFPTKILPNGFINKGRCAIGGTRMEIKNKDRCSIIVVPNISIVKSKKNQHSFINAVYGDISHEEVYQYLLDKKQGQKIMTTPEGMKKIMWAAEQTGRTEELYNDWFLMLDEAHTFITEDYREEILEPFKHFWNFTNKCIISATPYYFTDPRMKELDYHEVRLTAKLGEITMVESLSVAATLDYILKNINDFPGNVHIFYNSVTEIVKAIERAGITDCNIFCADDRNGNNKATLGDLFKFYVEQPDDFNYKKINFYTCKYFEGWDMYDENATLILVTDIHKLHTKVGIADKGIQAFGRLRGTKDTSEPPKPYQLIHITNSLYNNSMKTYEEIVKDFTYEASFLIKQNNEYVSDPNIKAPRKDPRIIKYADTDKLTKLTTLNTMKLDQQINEAFCTEIYNNYEFIKEAWETKYDVDTQHSNLKLDTQTVLKRKSAAKQLEEDYKTLLTCKHNRQNGIINWNIDYSIEQEIRRRNPLAADASDLLDEATLSGLKYKISKVKEAVIIKRNELAEVKLLQLLDHHFKVGAFYTNEYIQTKLQAIYDDLKITTKNGTIRRASPAQLAESGRFEIKEDRKPDSKGKRVHGYRILRKQFNLLIAA